MLTTQDYLASLLKDRHNLADNLMDKGVEASYDETITSLVSKVINIPSGGGSGTIPFSNIFDCIESSMEVTKNA